MTMLSPDGDAGGAIAGTITPDPAHAHPWPMPVRPVGAARIERALADKERFDAFTKVDDKGAVIWTGSAPKRHPLFHYGKETISARRAAFLLFVGEIPPKHYVVSKATNPLDVSPWLLSLERSPEHPAEKHNRRRRNARAAAKKAPAPSRAKVKAAKAARATRRVSRAARSR